MKRNFFDIVNPDFFKVFYGKYKELNYSILSLINEEMQHSSGILSKEEIESLIRGYLNDRPNIVNKNDTEGEIYKEPSTLVREYEKLGWLISETSPNFTISYQFDPVAITLLRAMNNAVEIDEKPLESTGYSRTIYKLANDFNLDEATYTTEQMLSLKNSLDDNLRAVNAKIKKYLNALLKNDNQNAVQILKDLLFNYQDNVVSKSFNNLRTTDNPSKYKDDIIGRLNDYRDYHMQGLVDNYIKTKYRGIRNESNVKEAKEFFNNAFNEIIDMFQGIEERIDVLESKNTKYVSSAKGRLMFLLNTKDDLEGRIDDLLKQIASLNKIDDEEFTISEFDLYEKGRIDDSSLYTYQKMQKSEVFSRNLEVAKVSEEDKIKLTRQIERLTLFTIRSVDNFIMSQLKGRDEISINEIEIHTLDEFMILFLARIYSKSRIVHYEIEPLKIEFKYQGNVMENYKIRRKEQ